MDTHFFNIIFILLLVHSLFQPSLALNFSLPHDHSNIMGHLQSVTVQRGETLNDVARRYDVGFLEILEANPKVNFNYLHSGTKLIIPTKYILPNAPRKGIVINLSELRLYYFPPYHSIVMTYPIGIGREGDETPIIQTYIVEKKIHPTWYPTEDTREHELMRGIVLPESIGPGPNNPLGDYAMRLGLVTYLIHGTNDPAGVGLRISGGCIRMYPEDIEQLFSMVNIGTEVNIVDQPIKLGWQKNILYAEAHVPVPEKWGRSKKMLKPMSEVLFSQIHNAPVEIDWERALLVAHEQKGIPEPIGKRIYR